MAKRMMRSFHTKCRFPERQALDWEGPVLDYKEVDLVRKFLTASSRMMSRKRAGTSAFEQRQIKKAVKYARYMALVPYTGS